MQRKIETDLYIIVLSTFIILGIYMGFQNQFNTFAENDSVHILLRTAVIAFMQFGVAGLGITIVCILRKESFFSHDLQAKGTFLSILLSVSSFIPYILLRYLTGDITSYLPFQSVWMMKGILSEGFPVNVVGMLLIALSWGFFEGFNYVVICDKINERYPSANKWLNWGAIVCGVMCLLIHGLIGVSLGVLLEAVSVFIIIYGMLMARKLTGNAWGCVFVFIFLWNAF